MAEKDYSSTTMRIAGNIAAGLVGAPHFQHPEGVINHDELVAIAVDLARRIVITVQSMDANERRAKLQNERDAERAVTTSVSG